MLERAFFAAWAILCPKQIDAGSTRETELRSELTRCIQKHADKGFADSDDGYEPSNRKGLRPVSSGAFCLWRACALFHIPDSSLANLPSHGSRPDKV